MNNFIRKLFMFGLMVGVSMMLKLNRLNVLFCFCFGNMCRIRMLGSGCMMFVVMFFMICMVIIIL